MIDFRWHSVKEDGYPPDKQSVFVTVVSGDERYTWSDVRHISDLKSECYIDEFIEQHPDGVWEWAYEAGADYWEAVQGEIIAWMPYPEPYKGV